MFDAITLSDLYGKKVILTDNEGNTYTDLVSFYESEYDSGSGIAEIGLFDCKKIFRADEIISIKCCDT